MSGTASQKQLFYEVWFYFYGEDDPRTDFDKEFTFYCRTPEEIKTIPEMQAHFRAAFPDCVDEEDIPHMSRIIEISEEQYREDCNEKW